MSQRHEQLQNFEQENSTRSVISAKSQSYNNTVRRSAHFNGEDKASQSEAVNSRLTEIVSILKVVFTGLGRLLKCIH